MPSNIPPLAFGNFYHIYNRGNNRENVFIQERNYIYFMELWWKHTFQIAETYAYCLLRNHFHAVVYIRNQEDLTRDLTGFQNLSGLKADFKIKEPSQYFSNLFNAYTRGVNLATQRTGALFERPFERILVTNEAYFLRLVVYVHQNPQKHKFVEDFRDWNYSSYHELIANLPTRLQRDKLLELFGSKPDFIRIHQEIQPLEDLDDEE
jgi:REP element-mobilizing transposase RayT